MRDLCGELEKEIPQRSRRSLHQGFFLLNRILLELNGSVQEGAPLPDSTQLDRLAVVLVATRNPLNIGAAARAMSNFGFLNLRVVNPYEVAFREARSAVGAAPLLANAQESPNVAAAIEDCTLVVGTTALGHRELHHPLFRVEQGASLIRQHLTVGRVAVLFGSEKRGLSNDDLSHCNWLMHIPTREEHYSMNLGQAVAVSLYELVRDAEVAALPEEICEPVAAGDLERISNILLEALQASEYMSQQQAVSTEESIHRLVRRLQLSAKDAKTWLGILRQIAWKLRSNDKNVSVRSAAEET